MRPVRKRVLSRLQACKVSRASGIRSQVQGAETCVWKEEIGGEFVVAERESKVGHREAGEGGDTA
jgi:hypothetical protein